MGKKYLVHRGPSLLHQPYNLKLKIDATMESWIVRATRHLHHHPNILRIREVIATRTKIYLVLDFIDGGELL